MAVTTAGVIAALEIAGAAGGVYSAVEGANAARAQKSEAKKSASRSLLAQQEEQKKALARQNAQQQGGYGSTLGSGSSALGG